MSQKPQATTRKNYPELEKPLKTGFVFYESARDFKTKLFAIR
jgi:hypothetical protein